MSRFVTGATTTGTTRACGFAAASLAPNRAFTRGNHDSRVNHPPVVMTAMTNNVIQVLYDGLSDGVGAAMDCSADDSDATADGRGSVAAAAER